jgi:hypothetical protein
LTWGRGPFLFGISAFGVGRHRKPDLRVETKGRHHPGERKNERKEKKKFIVISSMLMVAGTAA